jgi:hypothetical protein
MPEPLGQRITARPGTPEYQRQFEQQALAAADASLRLPFVRIICGVFAIASGMAVILSLIDSSLTWKSCLENLLVSTPLAVELGLVAFVGKSLYLRFMLSGVRRCARGTGKSVNTK